MRPAILSATLPSPSGGAWLVSAASTPSAIWPPTPGTDAEGIEARRLLDLLLQKEKEAQRWVEPPMTWEEMAAAGAQLKCACGSEYSVGSSCGNSQRHADIQTEIREKFPVGSTAWLNLASGGARFRPNTECCIVSHIPQGEPVNDTYPWGWIRVRFPQLPFKFFTTQYVAVPAFTTAGWHLTKSPVISDREADKKTGR